MAGSNQFAAESIKRHLAELKHDLAGAHPTPLESLLIGQIASAWLAVQHAELEVSASGGSVQQRALRLRQAESAHKRFLRTVQTLTTLRAKLPAGLVPLHHAKLHDPERETA